MYYIFEKIRSFLPFINDENRRKRPSPSSDLPDISEVAQKRLRTTNFDLFVPKGAKMALGSSNATNKWGVKTRELNFATRKSVNESFTPEIIVLDDDGENKPASERLHSKFAKENDDKEVIYLGKESQTKSTDFGDAVCVSHFSPRQSKCSPERCAINGGRMKIPKTNPYLKKERRRIVREEDSTKPAPYQSVYYKLFNDKERLNGNDTTRLSRNSDTSSRDAWNATTALHSVRLKDKEMYKGMLDKYYSSNSGRTTPSLCRPLHKSTPPLIDLTSESDKSGSAIPSPEVEIVDDKLSYSFSKSRIHTDPFSRSIFQSRENVKTSTPITQLACRRNTPSTSEPQKSDRRPLNDDSLNRIIDRKLYESSFLNEKYFKNCRDDYDVRDKVTKQQILEAEADVKLLSEKRDATLQEKLEKMKSLYSFKGISKELTLIEEIEKQPELTPEMLKVINDALKPTPSNELLKEAYNLTIRRKDMETLKGLNWLNDEIINFYFTMLTERGKLDNYPSVYSFNTFFYPKLISGGHAALKRWTRRVDLFSYDLLLIPVHLGMHWCLAVVDFKKKEIDYYDSMGGKNNQCLEAIKKYLEAESLDKKKVAFDFSSWTLENVKDIPQQMNGSDCGMFTCKYAEYISRNAKITFQQEDMPYFRKRLVYEIITNKLI